jgi:DNA-binding PadR family transcriptional regulator
MSKKEYDVESLLPLQSSTFYILMALGDGELHGYAIIQDIAMRTGGEVKLSAGTLYRSIQRMQEQGLIVESRRRPAPEEDDERRRYYQITSFGSTVIRAELRRLTFLIKLARSKGFAPEKA